jgi:bifunctional non-homologous end joining protein LigD
VTSFAALQDALKRGQAGCLSLLRLRSAAPGGCDLTNLPLIERKRILEQLFTGIPAGGPIRYSSHVAGQGPKFFGQACKLHLEGIVSKLATSPYRPGRSDAWRKVKCLNREEFVIGGWMASGAEGRSLRSLLLGYYKGRDLVFAGKVGTGFGLATGHELAARLRKIERKDPTFASVPRAYHRGARWVEPRLVAEVAFTSWTTDGVLRHLSFQGIREDKDARDVKLERATPKVGG